MKKCAICGAELNDNAKFCDSCGASQTPDDKEQRVLDNMARFLRYERTAWKVTGFVLLGIFAFYVLIAVLLIATGGIGILGAASSGEQFKNDPDFQSGALAAFLVVLMYGWIYLIVFAVAFVPTIIINLKMVKRVEFYQEMMKTDISVTRRRAISPGMIVFSAFFNKIAMAFIIVNFVKTRKNAKTFDMIEAKQKADIT